MNKEHIIPQLLLRSWPFPHGAGRITDRLFSNLIFSDETVEVSTTDGFKITVMPNEQIGRHIYLTGEFDRSIVDMLCKLSKAGDTLLDVGANIGYVSACFLKQVAQSNVIAVEPQPTIVDLLRKNLTPFEHRYQILPVALSNEDGTCYFHIDTRNRGASKIVDRNGPSTEVVEMWSVDRMLAETTLSKIDLIKLDVEGHEEQVLSALMPALKQFRPRAILFEDQSNKSAPNRPIGVLLRTAGYRVFGLKKYLTKLHATPITSEADCLYNDYVAMRTE
jgi:FkbM family methyltransferase